MFPNNPTGATRRGQRYFGSAKVFRGFYAIEFFFEYQYYSKSFRGSNFIERTSRNFCNFNTHILYIYEKKRKTHYL